jgi:hypothetical protein
MAINDVDNFDDDELRARRSIFDGKIDVSVEVVVVRLDLSVKK